RKLMKLDYHIDITPASLGFEHTVSKPYAGLPFTVSSFGHYIANQSYYTKRFGMENYLLLYTLNGKGFLEYMDKKIVLGANQVVLIDCRHYQFYRTYGEEQWDFNWVHFNGAGVSSFFNLINENSVNVMTVRDHYQMNLFFNELAKMKLENELLIDVKFNSTINQMLTTLIENRINRDNLVKYTHHKNEIETVISFIEKNYSQKLSIDDMVSLIFISKYHFLRLFKVYSGVTPYEYLINKRVTVSKQLLKESNDSINEIAAKIGFGNATVYIKYFKRLTNLTPNQFRKFYIY
ncbi:MAG: helix-turn-helix domain-containing protein, partial [Clostridia bacterium]|nr:helix-turn-helix domain-containing protein [Clostridia bacterium]